MTATIKSIIDHYQFDRIPIEGTFYKSTYVAPQKIGDSPLSTAIIGLYTHHPKSVSLFHRLKQDEVWHFYAGQAFALHLLFPDGTYQKIIMGNDINMGEQVQFVVPAHVWQAGELLPNNEYALFGCTLSPGFTGTSFEGGLAVSLLKQYPAQAEIIQRLAVKGHDTNLPKGFTQ